MKNIKDCLLRVFAGVLIVVPLLALMVYTGFSIYQLEDSKNSIGAVADVKPLDSVDYGDAVFSGSRVSLPVYTGVSLTSYNIADMSKYISNTLTFSPKIKSVSSSGTYNISLSSSVYGLFVTGNDVYLNPSILNISLDPYIYDNNGGSISTTRLSGLNYGYIRGNQYSGGVFKGVFIDFLIDIPDGFDFTDIVAVSFGYVSLVGNEYFDIISTLPISSRNATDSSYFLTNFRYLTSSGSFLDIYFSGGFGVASDFPFRTYYFDRDFSSIDGYQQGYADGFNSGVSSGSSSGYNDGYKYGNIVGYQNGYNAGVNDSSNYTFLGLIGAVVDAPVNAFIKLLNFDILGFNMLNFITGVFTFAIILFVVRLVLGKGG